MIVGSFVQNTNLLGDEAQKLNIVRLAAIL